MPRDFESDTEEDDEIEKIIETGKEIKLELKAEKPKPSLRKKTRKTKSADEQPKIQVAPVLKEPAPVEQEKVSYVLTSQEKVASEVKPAETKITFTAKETPAEIKAEPVETPKEAEISSAGQEKQTLTAHDILTKSEAELKSFDKRETHNMLQDMRIITAILLGKKKNKELAQVLQTDKSFTSKQIKELEEQGLVKREGEGKEVSYEVDTWNVLKFLQSKVVIKWKKDNGKQEGETK